MQLSNDALAQITTLLKRKLRPQEVNDALARATQLPDDEQLALTPLMWDKLIQLVSERTTIDVLGKGKKQRNAGHSLLGRAAKTNNCRSLRELLLRFMQVYLGPLYVQAVGRHAHDALVKANFVSWVRAGKQNKRLDLWSQVVRAETWHLTQGHIAANVQVDQVTLARTLAALAEMLGMDKEHPLVLVYCYLAVTYEREHASRFSAGTQIDPDALPQAPSA